jgi:hypothetical protein
MAIGFRCAYFTDHRADPVTQPAESPEFLPPKISLTWKAGMVALLASAAMILIGTYRTLYAYEYRTPESSGDLEGNHIIVTLWAVTNPTARAKSVPPDYKVPLIFAAVLLIVSVAVLLTAAAKPSGRQAGRTLTLASAAFLGGVTWTVFLDVTAAQRQYAGLSPDPSRLMIIFTFGDAAWFFVVAAALAIAGWILVLTRPMAAPRLAGPMIYQISAED